MPKKRVVQMPVDEKEYEKVVYCARQCHASQAQTMRRALDDLYKKIREVELDRQYREAYEKHPDDAGAGELQLSVVSEVLEEEDW